MRCPNLFRRMSTRASTGSGLVLLARPIIISAFVLTAASGLTFVTGRVATAAAVVA